MKVAINAPIEGLGMVPHTGLWLCLDDLVRSSKDYAKFHAIRSAYGDIVILDTPIHEKKGKVETSPTLLYQAAMAVRATYIVIPDFDEDFSSSLSTLQEYGPILRSLSPTTKLMFVVHGHNIDEFNSNLKQALDKYGDFINAIGIPFISSPYLDSNTGDGRLRALSVCAQVCPSLPVQLLGCHYNTREIQIASGYSKIIGVDTSKPFSLALHNVNWRQIEETKAYEEVVKNNTSKSAFKDFYHIPKEELYQKANLIAANCAHLINMANGGYNN